MLDKIKAMDKKSEEFFKVYQAVNEKYWSIDDPDDLQMACMFLNTLINRGDDFAGEIVLATKLVHELAKMKIENTPALHGSFAMKGGKEMHFDFYTDKSALTNLEKMLRHSVIVKAKEIKDE